MTYFLFGSFPLISLAELWQSIQGSPGTTMPFVDRWATTVDGISVQAAQELFDRLGGCPRVGIVVQRGVRRNQLENVLIELVQHLEGDRINFGLSVVGSAVPLKQVQGIGITIKRRLKEHGRSSRFVVSRDPILSSVVVTKNHLLTKGAEFLIARESPSRFMIVQTIAVQEFEQWGARDFGRPSRNARRGMLPPKLARIMVNLTNGSEKLGVGSKKSSRFSLPTSHLSPPTLLDPFCGSGTILMEALELGYNVIGSDVSAQAVEDTRKNLEWLRSSLRVPTEGRGEAIQKSAIGVSGSLRFARDDRSVQLFVSDARNLAKKLPPHSIDAIVTEPDLGPPQSQVLRYESEIESARSRLSNLYLKSLTQFSRLLKPGGRVVMSMPVWQVGSRKWEARGRKSEVRSQKAEGLIFAIDALHQIKGFQIVRPYQDTLYPIPNTLYQRQTLLYGRPDQFVWREIVILESRCQ